MRPALGGWEFPQPYNGGTVPLSGNDAEDLLENVTTFRIENGLPLGEPAREIAEYIKAKSPGNNGGRRAAIQEPVVSHLRAIVPMIEHCKVWLVAMLKRKDIVLVREDEANDRAQVCQGCPQNISWRTSCGGCNDDIDYKSNTLRQRPRSTLDKKLRACRLHRFPLQSAIFIDRDQLPPRHDNAPELCWVRK